MTKSQFYATWIILGFAAWFGLSQAVALLTQLLISLGIEYDAPPLLVKYGHLFVYGIAWIALLIIAAGIISDKGPRAVCFKLKNPRLVLVVLLTTGIICRLIFKLLEDVRKSKLINYIDRHNLNEEEFIPWYIMSSIIPGIVVLVTLIIVFFLITGSAKEQSITGMDEIPGQSV